MIVYDLSCSGGHRFEGWFASSEDFAAQNARGIVQCPECGSAQIAKAPMAPAVGRKGNQAAAPTGSAPAAAEPMAVSGGEVPPQLAAAIKQVAALQAEMLKNSRWVGDKFAEQSRAMHYGEREIETIHGKATAEEAKELLEEGVALLPLPFPVASPDELN